MVKRRKPAAVIPPKPGKPGPALYPITEVPPARDDLDRAIDAALDRVMIEIIVDLDRQPA